MCLNETSWMEPSGKGPPTVNKHELICQWEVVTSCSGPPRPARNAHGASSSESKNTRSISKRLFKMTHQQFIQT